MGDFFLMNIYLRKNSFLVPDFIAVQRNSFSQLLEKGLIDEISKRNPITNSTKELELCFYPKYYKLSPPELTSKQAILKNKTYSCRLYIPVQLTNKRTKTLKLQWVLLGNLPLMTKRGHFIINGSPRVIINQMVRSPGIYFKEVTHSDQKRTYLADLIAYRGAWLRIELDKKAEIWARMKKTPKLPMLILLQALGLNLPTILKSLNYPTFFNYSGKYLKLKNGERKAGFTQLPQILGSENPSLTPFDENFEPGVNLSNTSLNQSLAYTEKGQQVNFATANFTETGFDESEYSLTQGLLPASSKTSLPSGSAPAGAGFTQQSWAKTRVKNTVYCKTQEEALWTLYAVTHPNKNVDEITANLGKSFLYRKFMNSRTYDLSPLGRLRLNKKLNIAVNEKITTITAQDLLFITNTLINLSYGIGKVDDIDNLKNRRIRTAGELVQNQFGIGLLRLEKIIREKLKQQQTKLSIGSLINTKPINGALREFFGSSPLSQFMDQTNPLAEITHKRRISSLGPGGVNRETAGMAIRGIHPTHYGRICPIETPEGQNAGLVNSLTIYSKVNTYGFIETPFYKVIKGQVQKAVRPVFFTADAEESKLLAPGDIYVNKLNYLPDSELPIRKLAEFTRTKRSKINYVAVSPLQMISIATSLIPFLEHDDANRALMGSNMQRQAVPLMVAEAPVVGTGLECRVASDSGHVIQAKHSGFVTYSSSEKITVLSSAPAGAGFTQQSWAKERGKNRPIKTGTIGNTSRTLNSNNFLSMQPEQSPVSPPVSSFGQKSKMKKTFSSAVAQDVLTVGLKAKLLYKNQQVFINKDPNLLYEGIQTTNVQLQNLLESSVGDKSITTGADHKGLAAAQDAQQGTSQTTESVTSQQLKGMLKPKWLKDSQKQLDLTNPAVTNQGTLQTKQVEPFTQNKVMLQKRSQLNPVTQSLRSSLTTLGREEGLSEQLKPVTYELQKLFRSNQDTSIMHRPVVREGEWVNRGDLLADNATTVKGELSLGKNLLLAYMPWEGYNFEDAILISERLVSDDLYTSLHIERYEVEIRETKFGLEQITNQIPDEGKLSHLDHFGVAKIGTWVEEGDILIGKVAPMPQKNLSRYEKLLYDVVGKKMSTTRDTSLRVPRGVEGRVIHVEILNADNLPPELVFEGPSRVNLYIAEKRKIHVGDKMAGRHGNKGIISNILPRQDMPYLPDGTPLDMVLNPLGVPSRMNVGQLYECLLGLAGRYLGQKFKVRPFDEIYGPQASRSLVYSKLYEDRLRTGHRWLFKPVSPGKTRLFDGRTGECFNQPVTVGQAYMLKLIHLVDEKIHARSIGPYSLVTQQPLRGRSKHGGQRLGEMEVWALEGFGAAYTLQELLTVKSDDIKGREQVMEAIQKNKTISLGTPESFKVLVRELQSLCLDVGVYAVDASGKIKQIDTMKLP